MSRLTDELVLSGGLWKHGVRLFEGITNFENRKRAARQTIKDFALQKELLGKHTYEWWFIRCYSEAL